MTIGKIKNGSPQESDIRNPHDHYQQALFFRLARPILALRLLAYGQDAESVAATRAGRKRLNR